MNPPSTPPVIARRASHRWLWVALAASLLMFAMLATIAFGVTSYFRLSSDTKALRNSLVKSSGLEWQPRIALNIGGMTLGAVRSGLSLANLKPEARAAVATVRGVEFGIYDLASDISPPARAVMLNAADKAMNARGWDRVVGVIDGRDLVAVYVPADMTSARRMQCCVMVFDGDQLVVVSAKANLQPMLDFALEKKGLCEKLHFFAKR